MKKAFTILELLVVVAIIAILAVAAIPSFIGRIDEAQSAANLAEIAAVKDAATNYFIDHGSFPTEQDIQPTEGYPMNLKFSSLVGGGYLSKLPSFSYWYIDYLAQVFHTSDKAETYKGTDMVDELTGFKTPIASDYAFTLSHPESSHAEPPEATEIDAVEAPTIIMTPNANETTMVYTDTTITWEYTSSVEPQQVEWENKSDTYTTEGSQTVRLRIKFNNTWSDWAEKTFYVWGVLEIADIAIGGHHTLVLKEDGSVWSFGYNKFGQLGYTENTEPNPTPKRIDSLGTDVKAIYAGVNHSAVIKKDNTVWVFGRNQEGQLGLQENSGTATATSIPTQLVLFGDSVSQIAMGLQHTMVLLNDGALWTFGSNQRGQLGTSADNGAIYANPAPRRITGITGTVATISAGGYHSAFTTTDGKVFTFGNNYYGQLGLSTNTGTHNGVPIPTLVGTFGSGVTKASLGEYHTIVLKADGTAWSFGRNIYGELGREANSGIDTANVTPSQLEGITAGFKSILAGYRHTVVVKNDDTVWSFGLNQYGQLGNNSASGSSNANHIPQQISTSTTQLKKVAVGSFTTAILKQDKSLWMAGHNYYGPLGSTINNYTEIANPTFIKSNIGR